MNRLVGASLTLLALCGLVLPLSAEQDVCPVPGPAAGAYDGAAFGPGYGVGGVSFVDRVMTGYRTETRYRSVPETITRPVTREVVESFPYTEQVPVVVAERRARTVYQAVAKQVPYTYTVEVPVIPPIRRTQTVYKTVPKQVPYSFTVEVPVVSAVPVTRVVNQTIAKQVPYTYTVNVPAVVLQKQTRAVNVPVTPRCR